MTAAPNEARPQSPLAQPGPWDLVSAGYDLYTREFLANFAAQALDQIILPEGARVVDVACGPGTSVLLLADRADHIDAVDFSAKMLTRCAAHLESRGLTNVSLHHGNGMELPLRDESYHLGLSMFGLMFFPDRVQGMKEIHRVLEPGGHIIIGSWAPAARSPLMQLLFDVLQVLDPSFPGPVSDIASLENPDVFRRELSAAGFSDVRVDLVESGLDIVDLDAFWTAMVEGSIPVLMLKNRLSSEEWTQRERLALAHLREALTLPCRISSFANIGYGVKTSLGSSVP